MVQFFGRRIAFGGFDVNLERVCRPSQLPELAFELPEIELGDGNRRTDVEFRNVDRRRRRLQRVSER